MKRYNYRNVQTVGSNKYSESENPLTYCINDTLDQRFIHGSNATIYGQNSKMCQAFLGEYCSQQWDGYCDIASQNTNNYYPNNTWDSHLNNIPYNFKGLTSGEAVIRNTAANKYLISMGNCVPKYEPFDYNVANSPMIRYWESATGQNNCVPVYGVDLNNIDNDTVMDKILERPHIGLDILINIHNNHKRMYGSTQNIKHTKLGNFFSSHPDIFK